jgi:hypothetical protein
MYNEFMKEQIENIRELAERQDALLKKTIWRMLQTLRSESSVNVGNIEIDLIDNEVMPSVENQRLSIRFLQEIGVIKIASTRLAVFPGFELFARLNNVFSNDKVLPSKYFVSVNFQKLTETLSIYREFFGNYTKYTTYFDAEQGRLFINKSNEKFRKNTNSYRLLKALFCDIEERNYLEEGADIEFIKDTLSNGGMDTELDNKELYRACKNINDKLHRNKHIDEFIIVEGSALKINKKYLFK